MEFLKKNWLKIITAVVMLVGIVFYIVLLTKFDMSYHNLNSNFAADPIEDKQKAISTLFTYITALTFFVLILAVTIMNMFDATRKVSKWILCAAGTLGVAFMLTAIITALNSEASAYARDIMSGEYDAIIQYAASAGTPLADIPLESWPTANAEALKAAIQNAKDVASYQYFSGIVTLVSQLIVFGLLPLIYAAKKIFFKKATK